MLHVTNVLHKLNSALFELLFSSLFIVCVIQPNTKSQEEKIMNGTSLKIKCLKDDDGTFHLHVGS